MVTALKQTASATASPFTGTDICSLAGLPVLPAVRGPRFDDDMWDFSCVDGLAVQMKPNTLRWQFTKIKNSAWRRTAKEYLAALLAPGHETVRLLPHAYRTPRSLHTCHARLIEMTLLFRWLHARRLSGMADLTQDDCDAYIEHRSWRRDDTGKPVAPMAQSSVACAYQVLIDLSLYRELFTADRYPADFRPWKGRTACAASGRSTDRANKTAPVAPDIFAPLLAAALYVVDTLGTHIVALNATAKHARQQPLPDRTDGDRAQAILAVIRRHLNDGDPFTALPPGFPTDRHNAIREPGDPLHAVSLRAIAREAGYSSFHGVWLAQIRGELEHALQQVGAQLTLGRDADQVTRADSDGQVPWTLPMTARGLQDLTCYARSACMTVIGALTGMRASETMELRRGCSVRSDETQGVTRHHLTGKLIKGQPLGGTAERWVVVEAVHRAVMLADQLQQDPASDALLFGRFGYDISLASFRSWVNGHNGVRLRLAPIPKGPVNLRMLRRRLAIELAYRPGGLLAAKVALKQIHVATTEGYAARPGGAQAKLLGEIAAEEEQRNLTLVTQAFDDYRNGILPSGPGARELVTLFDSVDGRLAPPGPASATSEQTVRTLVAKLADTLHLGVANFCWFSDPAKALCLKLAGTPTAAKPLAGMCDSTRCPQATHHPCHRPVWSERAHATKTFIASIGRRQHAERQRLQTELNRIEATLTAIDSAASRSAEQGGEDNADR